ncbi:MAG TPA: DivIVA domain-containing protein [Bacillota bacterium]|nr:MAG: Septum site-determining protein DivIVA [Firmicutes bacterium ADurb.Bin153]HNV34964.1 DivIVA domain-containing protein [Bacillota bacterium]HPU96178.1 DivIVA domain-containing protein [Bacillota bacterium]
MITPLELMNKEFTVRMRGYDRSEVDDFLSVLQKDYETLFRYYRKTSGADAIEPIEEEEVREPAREPQGKEASEARARQLRAEAVLHEEAPARQAGAWTRPAEHDLGESVKEILLMAQKAAEDARTAAGAEAAAIVEKARLDASKAVYEADEKVKAAERRLADLSAQEASLRARMKGFLETYRQLIDDFEATSGIDYSL